MFKQLRTALIDSGDWGPASERNVEIFLRLRGFDGGEPQSLRQVAVQYDLSSERVRQISNEVGDRLRALKDDKSPDGTFAKICSSLHEIMEIIGKQVPTTDSAVTSELVARNLIPSDGSSASSALRVASELFGPQTILCDTWGSKRVLLSDATPRCYPVASSVARKIVASSGVVSTSELGAALQRQQMLSVAWLSEPELRTILECCCTLLAVEDDNYWFHLPGSTSDALTRIANHVSALGSYNVLEASSQGARMSRSRYHISVPPKVMASYLRANGYRVDGNLATISGGTTGSRLSGVQQKMVGILRRMGGSIPQAEYVRACKQEGINSSTARVYLHRSGLFEVRNGMCTLLGGS